MQSQAIDWRGGIVLGAVAGVVFGWVALAVNAMSGAFSLENGLAGSLLTFSVGGAVFGLVASGFLSLLKERLPFRNIYVKAVVVATGLWATLEIGALALASLEPDRYHLDVAQALQGLALAVVLGGLLGLSWKLRSRKA